MFGRNQKRRAAVAAIAMLIVTGGASAASAHTDGSRGGGTGVALTAGQEACLTANGHVHPTQGVAHVRDAAHKTANDAAYTACGIARPTKSVAAATA